MTVTSDVNSDQQIPTGLSASGIELTERLLEIVVAQDPMPGDRLPSERRLSELLGVGRHVVRDSLKVLHLLGFVEVRQGQGTFWRNNSTSSLPRSIEWRLIAQSGSTEDLVEARSEVEVLVCGLAAARGTDERLAEIRQYYEFMRLAAATDNVELYSRSDISFHLAIAKAARNTVLETMLTSIRTLIATWTDRVLEDIRLEESFAVHEPIMAALDSGDADAARAAMRQHMDAATANLLRIAGDIS